VGRLGIVSSFVRGLKQLILPPFFQPSMCKVELSIYP
jgi:hypothetical protein